MIRDGNDIIFGLKEAPSGKNFLSYTKTGPLDGFPVINIYDSVNLRQLNSIAVSDEQIDCIEYSVQSNMLLVISSSE